MSQAKFRLLSLGALLAILILSAACGADPLPTATPPIQQTIQPTTIATITPAPATGTTTPTVAPSPTSTIIPTIAPVATSTTAPVSATPVVLQLAGANWTMPDTHGFAPLAAANNHGVLWVKYPPAVPDGGPIGSPRPIGDYAIMYTPLRSGGGDLADGARLVLIFSGRGDITGYTDQYSIDNNNRYIGGIDSVADTRFLLSTFESTPGAAHGGDYRWWWLEPSSGKIELLGGPAPIYGAALAHNNSWWMWSGISYSEPSEVPFAGLTYLVNLYTGEKRTLKLPGAGTVCGATWGKDGLLTFQLCTTTLDNTLWTLDPNSETIAPALCSQRLPLNFACSFYEPTPAPTRQSK